MNWKDFVAALVEFLRNVWLWMLVIARRHSMALVGSAIVVLAVMSLWSWYREWRTTEFVILAGPGGSMGTADANRIGRRVAGASSALGPAYRVRVEATEGFEEIRRLVNEDRTGTVIGFAHDGFGNSENVRVLLPLDRNYLHILCRREFLEKELGKTLPAKLTLADLLKDPNKLKPGRVFTGPLNSGTRQLAELVLERHVVDVNKYQTNGIANWHEMRAALNNDNIDVAFYSGRLDSDIVRDIAKDGSSVLVGLNGDSDAIVQGRAQVQTADFKVNSYANGAFCPEPLKTITSRRVLICSSYMSDETAYFLAEHSLSAMRSLIPDIEWNNPPPDAPKSTELTYQLHPGAERLKLKNPPGIVSWNTNYVLLTLALWIATELVQSANKRLRKRPADDDGTADDGALADGKPQATAALAAVKVDPAAAEAASRDAYDSLEREIHDDVYELIELPSLSKGERAEWMRKVRERRGRVERLREEGHLLAKHSDALLTAVDKLESAMERRNGKPHQGGPPKRIASRSK